MHFRVQKRDKLDTTSEILCDQIRTIDNQRIINEKITTRHDFPMDLDMYPYSLTEFEKSKEITEEEEKQIRDTMQYNLTGIICHIGNAESGHYISYIKIANDKWV